MADFTKNIKIVVDTVVGKGANDIKSLTSGFKDLGKEVGATEGIFGKAKVAAGGAFDLIAGSPAALASAGLAVGAFAVKAVGAFQDTALAAGKLSDATGLSVDQASRWNEVAGDIGISTDSLESSFGRLAKNIGANPAKFEELGLSIVRAKDGTIDMNATILNAIDLLNSTPDAAKRAALGAQLFGKGWQSIAELVAEGSSTIADNLKKVNESKVIDKAELEQARKFRDTMKDLGDVVEDVTITFGQFAVATFGPLLKGVGQVTTAVDELTGKLHLAGGASDLVGKLTGAFTPWGQIGAKIKGVTGAFDSNNSAIHRVKDAASAAVPVLDLLPNSWFGIEDGSAKAAKAQEEAADQMRRAAAVAEQGSAAYANLNPRLVTAAQNAEEAAAQDKVLADAAKEAADAAQRQADVTARQVAIQAELLAQNESILDAYKTLPDRIDDVADSQDAVTAAVAAYNKEPTADKLRAVEKAAASNADAQVKLALAQAQATGATVSQTEQLDITNRALIGQAATLNGPARQAIINRIAALNGIPPTRLTEILANIPPGDILAIEAALRTASRTRETTIQVDEQGAATANKNIDFAARDRTSIIHVIERTGTQGSGIGRGGGGAAEGGVIRMANGGTVTRLVGERGPELVGLPEGSQVIPAERLENLIRQTVSNIAHINVTTPRLSSAAMEREIVKALRSYERRNGSFNNGRSR